MNNNHMREVRDWIDGDWGFGNGGIEKLEEKGRTSNVERRTFNK